MTTIDEEQLKLEIAHIFESGANEIRILEMVKSFVNSRNIINQNKPQLPLERIKTMALDWAKDRSVGNAEQDDECRYDYECGMLSARSILLNVC